jgi:hypothetical protein
MGCWTYCWAALGAGSDGVPLQAIFCPAPHRLLWGRSGAQVKMLLHAFLQNKSAKSSQTDYQDHLVVKQPLQAEKTQ